MTAAGIAAAVVSFAAMEGVSYASHRWLMHGPGMGWHRSHHAPPKGRWEANDAFPACFSLVGFGLFLAAAFGASALWPVAIGVTVYGIAYLVVHELVIHRRIGAPVPDLRYFAWVRRAHREHHRTGGEPFGMLLPLLPAETRQRLGEPVPSARRDPLERVSTR